MHSQNKWWSTNTINQLSNYVQVKRFNVKEFFFFCWRILLISRFSMKFSLLSMCNSPPMDRIGPQMGITPHLISSPQKQKTVTWTSTKTILTMNDEETMTMWLQLGSYTKTGIVNIWWTNVMNQFPICVQVKCFKNVYIYVAGRSNLEQSCSSS